MPPTTISKTADNCLSDREDRIAAFMEDVTRGAGDVADGAPVTLVARSTSSPVVHAVTAFARTSGRTVRAVFLEIDSTTEDHAENSILDLGGAEFRVLNDSRFGAAHEQLTLDNHGVWIGDCMRRDPSKRDAFEIYHECHPAAHRDALASFSRLWAIAQPLTKRHPRIAPQEAVIAATRNAASNKRHRILG